MKSSIFFIDIITYLIISICILLFFGLDTDVYIGVDIGSSPITELTFLCALARRNTFLFLMAYITEFPNPLYISYTANIPKQKFIAILIPLLYVSIASTLHIFLLVYMYFHLLYPFLFYLCG